MFRDLDGGGVHGLNERIRVRSLYDGNEFLYRLVKAKEESWSWPPEEQILVKTVPRRTM